MKNLVLTILLSTCIIFIANGAFALSVTSMDTADNLAQTLLGSGVTISNVSYTGANAASGYFTDGLTSGIGIDEGILLTSGFASNAGGNTNTSDSITGNNGLPGDSTLDGLIPGYTTYDATILEFDFVSSGDAAYFNYIFASDEYNEWADTAFNDVFGFFVEGNNYALIPGTSTPVSINNVNNNSYSQYYNNNDPSDTSVPYPFEYDGFTDTFTTSITNLTPGEAYHMTLGIADAGDHILDSGVFLEAGSFSDTPTEPIPEPATMLLMGTGLLGLAAGRRYFTKRG